MQTKETVKRMKRRRRALRVRAKMTGTDKCPRVSMFRSLQSIAAQAIDDTEGRTVASWHSKRQKTQGKKVEISYESGKYFGGLLKEKGITQIVFDRGSYRYHGRVKAFADGIREAGIKF